MPGLTITMSAPSAMIERHLAQGLLAVAGVHLVGASCRKDPTPTFAEPISLAVGAVEGGGVFGGVGHDRHLVPAGRPPAPRTQRRRPARPSCRTAPGCRHPASACIRPWLHQHLHGRVIEDAPVPRGSSPSWPWSGEGVERHVAEDADLGRRVLHGLDRPGRPVPRGSVRLGASRRPSSRRRCRGKTAMAGTPRARASRAASAARATDRRGAPGMEATGTSGSRPSCTTIDQIRSDGVSVLSRTRARTHGAWRRRRRRRAG